MDADCSGDRDEADDQRDSSAGKVRSNGDLGTTMRERPEQPKERAAGAASRSPRILRDAGSVHKFTCKRVDVCIRYPGIERNGNSPMNARTVAPR